MMHLFSLTKNKILEVFILLVMVTVLLPCTTKRDIKSVLGAPIASSQIDFQKTKTACTVLTTQSSERSSQRQKGSWSSDFYTYGRLMNVHLSASVVALFSFNHRVFSAVRLHQWIEQYII